MTYLFDVVGESIDVTIPTLEESFILVAGPQGIQGATGANGATGPTGPTGSPGIALLGSVATFEELPGSPAENDAYLVEDQGKVFIFDGTDWGSGLQWIGPEGPQGDTGPAGPQGIQGVAGVGQRPSVFHVDDYGADPTGATSSSQAVADAYAAMGSSPGVIEFGIGTYRLTAGLNAANGTALEPLQGIRGQGSGVTKIDFRGTGACFEFRDTDFFNTNIYHQHGGCHGLSIVGWLNSNTNTYGIRYGDMWRVRISDVEIVGLNKAGCIGLWGDNQVAWSERAFVECVVSQCTECFVFESNTGSTSSGSFDYSQYWLSFIVQPGQHAFVLRSGSAGSKVSMNGASVTLTGNCQLSSGAGVPNTGELFRVGKDNDDAASYSGELQIGVETSGSTGGVGHYDFMMGDGPYWLVASRVTASGSINLIPFSGARFQTGNATPRTFAFGGMLKNSPALGSTGTVRSFQSLQLDSQARGGWYLDETKALQSVYVKAATGGTFTLSFGGYTTAALAHNASAAAVEAALGGLASIGSGNVSVVVDPARFVNSVAQNEHGYAIEFTGSLSATPVSTITVNAAGLTGGVGVGAEVVVKNTGSTNPTYVFGIEEGSIFTVEPSPGTYRLRIALAGLTAYGSNLSGGDSPFGVTTVDIWIKQPDTGGPAIIEGPFFPPVKDSGSTFSFKWVDGIDPVLSTTPGSKDIIRLTSYNFSVWFGQHLTRQVLVAAPATPTSAGVKGQRASDGSYMYECIATNTWRRTLINTW